uniref:Uncharacterized protein n=1 Tax=Tanacetum cinerariifolium TaxID=118510 RepID=A0A699K2S4_TANCI|nr:hypothetical protein [Tanacetum cinerariifolium]
MSSEEAKKESTKSDSDEEAHVTGSMVKSSKEKKLKKFDFRDARTLSSLLLVEVDKRNLNPLKQMIPIEQLRQ